MDYLSRWNNRRVLITGGTGFIGRHVVAAGLSARAEIHTLSRGLADDTAFRFLAEGPDCSLTHVHVHHHQVDLRDRERIRQVMTNVRPEAIIHLAASGVIAGPHGLPDMLDVNVGSLAALLDVAIDMGITPSVVVAGSGFEYAPQAWPITEDDPVRPFSAYGVSKASATLVAAHFAKQMPVTVLRLFSVFGEGEREPRLIPQIIASALNGLPVNLTGCEQVRDYAYVGDVAECFWRALSAVEEGKLPPVLNMGTGQRIRLRDLVEKLALLLEERGYAPQLQFGALPYRPGEPMTYVANIKRLSTLLNWTPSTSIEDGLRRMLTESR